MTVQEMQLHTTGVFFEAQEQGVPLFKEKLTFDEIFTFIQDNWEEIGAAVKTENETRKK